MHMTKDTNVNEAQSILNMVLQRINAFDDIHTQAKWHEYSMSIEKLEVMLLIYNTFSDIPLYLYEDDESGLYSLEPIC